MKVVSTKYKKFLEKYKQVLWWMSWRNWCKIARVHHHVRESACQSPWLGVINIPSVLLLGNNFDFNLLQYFKYFCWFQKRKMSLSEVKPSKICSTFGTDTLKHEKNLSFYKLKFITETNRINPAKVYTDRMLGPMCIMMWRKRHIVTHAAFSATYKSRSGSTMDYGLWTMGYPIVHSP